MWEVREERTCRFSITLDASTSGEENTLAWFSHCQRGAGRRGAL